jgi:hypothetical protein
MPTDLRESIFALALAAPDLDAGPGDLVITHHAVQRYRERAEAVPYRLAVRRLRELLTTARWRCRPLPSWGIVLHDGVVYGYSRLRPGVCLLVREQVLVTVLSRPAVPAQRRAGP